MRNDGLPLFLKYDSLLLEHTFSTRLKSAATKKHTNWYVFLLMSIIVFFIAPHSLQSAGFDQHLSNINHFRCQLNSIAIALV